MLDDNEKLWGDLSSSGSLKLVAGPCVIEDRKLCLETAAVMRDLCAELEIPYVFKSSFDKANRTSDRSFRGPGLKKGLEILAEVRATQKVPVTTDIHEPGQAAPAAEVADILQVPAFLCRQTDIIKAAVETGKIVNIKKGQFISPNEMLQVAGKARAFGATKLIITERGTTFGYNNLVVDMRAFPILKATGFPVFFDATHSVQLPGGGGDKSSGQRQFALPLSMAAVSVGADGLFIETHPKPDNALSDGPNMIPLDRMREFLSAVINIYQSSHYHA
ncbi:MAG: 3-deoxy-8-phosphooctulonate synthase [Verrucomicrobia bacterium]|nr:3-deoxy-8-phosphooctulonate synthase [Verrucomicrobiota bacterium]MCF7708756.1 3-deoxy-8-phosphooctulonate synthase [Verrucomicrobiota bacterium]